MSDPIFIVGMPRSGTTLLASMLNAHPAVAVLPETHLLSQHTRPSLRPMRPSRGLGEGALRAFARSDAAADLSLGGKQCHELLTAASRANDAIERLRITFMFLGLNQCAVSGTLRWGEKTPAHLEWVPTLFACFPQAHFVYIVRDPRDVAASLARVPWAGRHPAKHGARWAYYDQLAEKFSLRWPETFHTISYEFLTGQPTAALKGLCNELGLAFTPEMLNHHASTGGVFNSDREPWKAGVLKPVTSANVGKWKDSLSRRDRVVIEAFASASRRSGMYPQQHAMSWVLGFAVRPFSLLYGPLRRLGAIMSISTARQLRSPKSSGLMISWLAHHGRSVGLARTLNLEPMFSSVRRRGLSVTAPIRYVYCAFQSVVALLLKRPSFVMVMVPPTPAALVVAAGCMVLRIPFGIDMHTGALRDRKWRLLLPALYWAARRARVSIVTNQALANQLADKGIRVTVLDDAPEVWPSHRVSQGNDYVLVPLSFAPDEPIEAILECARRLPRVTFRLTGQVPPRWRAALASVNNVELLGFISRPEYEAQLVEAKAVVALTLRPFTMQRAGYEAMSASRPLVTSSTDTLMDYFNMGAVFANPRDGSSIADALTLALAEADRLSAEMATLRTVKRSEYITAAGALRRVVWGKDDSTGELK